MSTYNQPLGKYNQAPATYNGPLGILYAQTGYTYTQDRVSYAGLGSIRTRTLGFRARIAVTRPPATLQAKAFLRLGKLYTLSSKAFIILNQQRSFTGKARIVPIVQLKARISQQHGWPIPDLENDNYLIFVATQLQMRSSLASPSVGGATLSMQAILKPIRRLNLSLQARITATSGITMKARIQPRSLNSHVTGSFSVQATTKQTARVVFYIPGSYSVQSLGIRSMILGQARTRVTGHYIVSRPRTPGKVVAFDFDNSLSHRQMLGVKALVVHA